MNYVRKLSIVSIQPQEQLNVWFLIQKCGSWSKIWSIVPDEITESTSLETFRQNVKLWEQDSCHVTFAKYTLKYWHL